MPADIIGTRRNEQGRSIKEVLGHLIDSASNNTHRIIHLQYRTSPVEFPNYASQGNNDRWIAIQNFQDEDWPTLVYLWKYCNLHLIHVISNIRNDAIHNQWIADSDTLISLEEMVLDYPKHTAWHLEEIAEMAK
jgi:hypothetical protein